MCDKFLPNKYVSVDNFWKQTHFSFFLKIRQVAKDTTVNIISHQTVKLQIF